MIIINGKRIHREDPNFNATIDEVVNIQNMYSNIAELLKENVTISENGFLISSYTANDYNFFLDNTGVIFARNLNNQLHTIDGYLLSLSGTIVIKSYSSDQFSWKSNELRNRYSKLIDMGNFEYLEQIAVRKNLQGSQMAYQIHEEFINSVRKQAVIAGVVSQPIYNDRSHRFFERAGYTNIADFSSESHKGLKDVRTTLFLKEISN